MDQKAQVKFEMTEEQAKQPYTLERVEEFVKGVIDRSQPVLRKTEKTASPNKLTRENFDEKFDNSKDYDIILFLYSTETDQDKEVAKKVFSLFNYLMKEKNYKENKKLLLLRCDIFRNEIDEKLGFLVGNGKALPKILYYRHRMKDRAIHFNNPTVSSETVI